MPLEKLPGEKLPGVRNCFSLSQQGRSQLAGILIDWLFGSNAYGWVNEVMQHATVRVLGERIDLKIAGGVYHVHLDIAREKDWWMIVGSVFGAMGMAFYGWRRGWYVNADHDDEMRSRRSILGATIPGPIV